MFKWTEIKPVPQSLENETGIEPSDSEGSITQSYSNIKLGMEINIDRELLIRIDERQKAMNESINRIELAMTAKVDNNQDYKDLVNQVKVMWDLKNKAMGYIAAWSALIAVAAAVIIEWIKGLLFNK